MRYVFDIQEDWNGKEAGSLRRVPAAEVEALVACAVREHLGDSTESEDRDLIRDHVVRVDVQADQLVVGTATSVEQIAARDKCSIRQVNMTISLAFLAPDLVKAAVEGRLPVFTWVFTCSHVKLIF